MPFTLFNIKLINLLISNPLKLSEDFPINVSFLLLFKSLCFKVHSNFLSL
uniref:Uncharacterized protein n=1 Tax=Rhizophagus irregularis (strain DAOM 181602 / DAOM 197198 / MUCL 43194) TaxID=747089 RepID=U9T9S4_RHIID